MDSACPWRDSGTSLPRALSVVGLETPLLAALLRRQPWTASVLPLSSTEPFGTSSRGQGCCPHLTAPARPLRGPPFCSSPYVCPEASSLICGPASPEEAWPHCRQPAPCVRPLPCLPCLCLVGMRALTACLRQSLAPQQLHRGGRRPLGNAVSGQSPALPERSVFRDTCPSSCSASFAGCPADSVVSTHRFEQDPWHS